jgi:DNA-nicking Smr family endonuclease
VVESIEEVLLYGLTPGTEMKSRRMPSTDIEDFRTAVSGVRPLKPDNRLEHRLPRPRAVPLQLHRDEKSVLHELLQPVDDPADLETGEELLYLREGYPPRLLRRLRRGHFSVADSIDLHGMTQEAARNVLLRFLVDASRRGYGCVRVVHGKGLRSRGAPKLKMLTHAVLRKQPSVVAFASCRPIDGGTGAVNVLLNATGISTP